MRFVSLDTKKESGFTLVELLVVISIVGILTAIVAVSFSNARSNARDKARQADVASIQQAMRLFAEENGGYPDYPEGIEVGIGGTIDAELAPYFTRIPQDPLAGDGTHKYWYDSEFDCDGTTYSAVMALESETAASSNFEKVCGAPTSGDPENAHVVLIDSQGSASPATSPGVAGCTDPGASNYNSSATIDDGSCTYPVSGCTDPSANNYNASATVDDGSCTYDVYGCTNSGATNYNPSATVDDGSCTYPSGGSGGWGGGESGGGENSYGGGGDSGGNGGSVICTELYHQGFITQEIHEADELFGQKVSPRTLRGYHFWAKPVVYLMQRSQTFSQVIFYISKPWTEEMAYQVGYVDEGSLIGKVMMFIGIPVSWLIGAILGAVEMPTILIGSIFF